MQTLSFPHPLLAHLHYQKCLLAFVFFHSSNPKLRACPIAHTTLLLLPGCLFDRPQEITCTPLACTKPRKVRDKLVYPSIFLLDHLYDCSTFPKWLVHPRFCAFTYTTTPLEVSSQSNLTLFIKQMAQNQRFSNTFSNHSQSRPHSTASGKFSSHQATSQTTTPLFPFLHPTRLVTFIVITISLTEQTLEHNLVLNKAV